MRLFLQLFFLLLFSTSGFSQTTVTAKDFGKLSWLDGTWVRTNSKAGRSGTERWVKGTGDEWIGWGVSMKAADTSFVEKLKIVIRDGGIYYVSDVPENPNPVSFKLTAIDNDGFTCENPAHDFPKKIVYKRDGNKVRAVISGDGKEMEFLFQKQK